MVDPVIREIESSRVRELREWATVARIVALWSWALAKLVMMSGYYGLSFDV